MKRLLYAALVLTLVAGASTVSADTLSFYSSGGANTNLIAVNPATGQWTTIGPFGGGVLVWAGAFSPGGTFYVVTNPGSPTPHLATVDLATGAVTLGPALPAPATEMDGIAMLQFAPDGTLYGGSMNTLFTVDITTGALTTVGQFGATPFGPDPFEPYMMDLAMDSHGVLYGVASLAPNMAPNSYFYRIDRTTGHATELFSVSTPCIMGLAFDANDSLWGTNYCLGNSPFYSIDLAGHTVDGSRLTGLGYLHGGDIQPVPEPASMLLLASGLLAGVATRAWRKRKP